jgi:enoyl-CoA hydratase
VRVDGGPHALFGPEIANELEQVVDRVDHDSSVHAVVIAGAHPTRFISHADVRWLQEGGAATPSVGERGASAIVRAAEIADRARVLDPWSPGRRCKEPFNSIVSMRRSCG